LLLGINLLHVVEVEVILFSLRKLRKTATVASRDFAKKLIACVKLVRCVGTAARLFHWYSHRCCLKLFVLFFNDFNAPKTMAVSSESVLRFMPGSSERVLERS